MLITQSTPSTPSTSFTDDEIVSLLLEGNRAPLVTGEYQLPPKDLYLDDSDIKKFSAKPKELEKLWRSFQKQYFRQADELDNKNLLEFCHLIISEFNERNQANNDGNPASPKEPIIEINPGNTNDLQALSRLINNNIPQEQQELFWRDQILFGRPTFAKEIIEEQKHKFGTVEFENINMVRIVTEQIRDDYIRAIKADASFLKKGFELVGLGFGGAAFLVKASERHINIPAYVLKIPSSVLNGQPSRTFSDLEDEYQALLKETLFSINKIKGDRHSQRLAYYRKHDEPKIIIYLGQKGDTTRRQIPIIATTLSEGKNLRELARATNQRHLERSLGTGELGPDQLLNSYIEKGISDDQVLQIMKWYLVHAKEGINFYDLFPHNMIYDENKLAVKFLDYCSSPRGDVEQGILEARKAFPIDTLVFDLLTFLLLHEQKHPYSVEIRKSARITTAAQALARPENSALTGQRREVKVQQAYQAYIDSKFEQLKNCLDKALWDGFFTLEDLIAALNRLTSFREDSSPYGNHFKYLNKDFSRLFIAKNPQDRRGNILLQELHEYFSKKFLSTEEAIVQCLLDKQA